MAVVYDRAITAARGVINMHKPWRGHGGTECVAGCGDWPCRPFTLAFALITRNAGAPALR